MWVNQGKDPAVTAAELIEILFLQRIVFFCAITTLPTIIWLAYFLLRVRG
jgi:hypothetical protein